MVGAVHLRATLELLRQIRRDGYDGALYFDTFPDATGLDPVAECEVNIATVRRCWPSPSGSTATTGSARRSHGRMPSPARHRQRRHSSAAPDARPRAGPRISSGTTQWEERHGISVKALVAALRPVAPGWTRPRAGTDAAELGHRDDRVDWSELQAKFGDVPAAPDGTSIGGVSKTLTNEYWRTLGEGYAAYAKKAGVEVVYQAAQSEGDQLGQLSIAENLISQGFDALLLSPQTDNNLQPALESAEAQGIPVVNVNDAVIPSARHYVGNVQRDNGVRVAKWFLENRPDRRQGRGDRGPGGRLRRRPAHQGLHRHDHAKAASSPSSPAFPATGTASSPTTRPRRSCSSIPTSSASTPTMTAWPSASSKR